MFTEGFGFLSNFRKQGKINATVYTTHLSLLEEGQSEPSIPSEEQIGNQSTRHSFNLTDAPWQQTFL